MSSSSEAQIRSEIEKLTATINQHKAQQKHKTQWNTTGYEHGYGHKNHYTPYTKPNKYANPNFTAPNKYVRPGLNGPTVATGSVPAPISTSTEPVAMSSDSAGPSTTINPIPLSTETREVVLNGVAFESSGRSLVRKDLPMASKPVSTGPPAFVRKAAHVPPTRGFRSKGRRGRGRGGRNVNMTLNNTKRPYQSRKASKRKLIDKPCARFTTTGACSRGLTCPYQHDPSKIAICWNFLQDTCTNTAETCNLSHDPTPERTPLCVHFLNKGRCTRPNCPFPHVNVGQRDGVCRDFAVLGYCERGLDCKHQHVRECPDFAEKGTCETKGCKLPHVIRANRSRKTGGGGTSSTTGNSLFKMDLSADTTTDNEVAMVTAEDGQLGDEYISLTFRESDSDEDDEDDEEEGESDEEGVDDNDEGEDYEPELEVHV